MKVCFIENVDLRESDYMFTCLKMNEKEIDGIKGIDNFDEEGEVYQSLIKNKDDCLYDINLQCKSNALDGKKITDDWFPSPFFAVDEWGRITDNSSSSTYRLVPPDIFISHSHQDEQQILKLANYLYARFGIKSFIDSIFWKYCDDLLQLLDNKYNMNYRLFSQGYSYCGRNITTSHVHMMLAEALTNVIDNTECFLFIESDNSIPNIVDAIKNTRSPWIYHEINTVKSMRSRIPYRYALQSNQLLNESCSQNMLNFLQVDYQVDTNDYTEITAYDFNKLLKYRTKKLQKPEFYLDKLYKDKRISIRTCSDEFHKYVPTIKHEEESVEPLYEQAIMEESYDFDICEELRPYFDATIRLNNDTNIPILLNHVYNNYNEGTINLEECRQIFECLAYFHSTELLFASNRKKELKRNPNDMLNKKLIKHGLFCLSEYGDNLQLTQFGEIFFENVPQRFLVLGWLR